MATPASWMSSRAIALLALPAMLFLAVLFFYPLGTLIAYSFSGSGPPTANYQRILTTPVYLQVLQRIACCRFQNLPLQLLHWC